MYKNSKISENFTKYNIKEIFNLKDISLKTKDNKKKGFVLEWQGIEKKPKMK